MIQHGAGWGALEKARRAAQPCAGLLPGSFVFPPETLGAEQKKWLALLKQGDLPDPAPEDLPGEWMTQKEWQELLEERLQDPDHRGWFALLHLGVMRMEALDEAGAAACLGRVDPHPALAVGLPEPGGAEAAPEG